MYNSLVDRKLVFAWSLVILVLVVDRHLQYVVDVPHVTATRLVELCPNGAWDRNSKLVLQKVKGQTVQGQTAQEF